MNQIITIALLIIGIVLMIFGVRAIDSFSSDVSRFFTGAPTDKAIWMLIAGVVIFVVGVAGNFYGRLGK